MLPDVSMVSATIAGISCALEDSANARHEPTSSGTNEPRWTDRCTLAVS
jgi:hypothetical protein